MNASTVGGFVRFLAAYLAVCAVLACALVGGIALSGATGPMVGVLTALGCVGGAGCCFAFARWWDGKRHAMTRRPPGRDPVDEFLNACYGLRDELIRTFRLDWLARRLDRSRRGDA